VTRIHGALRRSRARAGCVVVGLLVCAVAGSAGPADATCDPERASAAVREVFEAYKDALVRGDGALANELVDASTLHYFEELRRTALEGSEAEVKRRPFVDRLLIVSMRHALAPEVIAELTFESLISTAMTEGWIQPETVAGLQMGVVEVTNGEATGEAISTALPVPAAPPAGGAATAGPAVDPALTVSYRFVCEEGEWKFRFASLVEQLDRLVSELTKQLGAEEDLLIFSLVEAFTGKKVLPEVWEPVRRGPPPG
jgi:hypothetical protein